ncbi:SEA (Seh1-associated) complex subunit [Acarospora aff. strigata]|nr:SEA (Seh1-associated) complex subunit [Acarospora aff. strigata]
MTDFFRLNSPPPPPPPAPPLPPQRYANRATSALVRFAQPFIYGSRPPSAQANRPEDLRGSFRPSAPRSSSPLSCKTTAHKTGIPIAALDISPTRTHVILAGREILKTVRVSGTACAEEFNLRSAIIAYASTHTPVSGSVSAKHKDQLAASDVKWSHGRFASTVATAAVNGRLVVYDINRSGVELARLHEHNRQVHKVAFNPHEGALLLSGSQDTTVKLWDLRALSGDRSVMTCRSIHRYVGNNDGVRDLKWSPTDGVEFATGTDNGVVQRWDLRKESAPLLKINAHEKTCHSIDWHPDGIHLASASADKNVKVWDFTSTDRRLKPSWEFRAPQAVVNVRWRPPCWSTETHSQGSWQCTHLATSYDQRDPRVHLWDFRRPNIPFREFDRYNSAPTDMLWHSEDLLWTVSNEGMFTQTDIHFAPKVLERRSLHAFDWSSTGDITVFSQKRPKRRGSGIEDVSADLLSSGKGRGSSGEKFSGSQSVTDGSLEDGFLSSSLKKRHSKTSSTRSSKSLGGTPPIASNTAAVVNLEKTLDQNGVYKPIRSITWYHVVGTFDADVFCYLANNYCSLPEAATQVASSCALGQTLRRICAENASHAEYAGQFRLSQSWKIIGLALGNRLEATDYHITHHRVDEDQVPHRVHELFSPLERQQAVTHATKAEDLRDHVLKGRNESDRVSSAAIAMVESTSNMTTPLVKPVSDPLVPKDMPMDLYDVDEEVPLAPDSIEYRSSPSSGSADHGPDAVSGIVVQGSGPEVNDMPSEKHHSPGLRVSQRWTDSYQEDCRAAADNYRPISRPLLRLDHPSQGGDEVVDGRLSRHDSNESFPMFSASTDSSHRARSMLSSFAESEKLGSLRLSPGRWAEHQKERIVSTPQKANGAASNGLEHDLRIKLIAAKDGIGEMELSHDDMSHRESVGSIISRKSVRESGNEGPQSAILYPDSSRQLIVNGQPTQAGALAQRSLLLSNSNIFIPYLRPSDSTQQSTSLPYIAEVSDPPWTATHMFPQLVQYHTKNLSDTQMPAYILFLLQAGLEPALVAPFLALHHAEALLTSYHLQLCSLGLYTPAAKVRKLSVRTSPGLTEQGMTEVHVRLWCRQCEKPLENRKKLNPWICERCEKMQATCPVCWSTKLPLGLPDASSSSAGAAFGDGEEGKGRSGGEALWSTCLTCGHGGHDLCIQSWFAEANGSEGGCPVQGCLHDCVPGVRRDHKIRRIAEEKVKKRRGIAKRDSWVVGESRAVEKARGVLQVGILGEDGREIESEVDGVLYNGVTSFSNSGGKRVRLVVPDEEQLDHTEERRPSEARPIPQRSGRSGVGASRFSAD